MKTCNLLASLLFGSLAAAAPLDRRALATKTEVVWETVVVYSTVWDSPAPKTEAVEAAATSSAGLFYEQHSKPAAQPTQHHNPPAAKPSSVYTPPPQQETHEPEPKPEPTSVYTPPPAPEAPKPTSVYTPPAPEAPKPSAPAPAQPSAPANNGNSQKYHGDITIYDINAGNKGACGTDSSESDFVVALAKPTWGESTYDVMTGEATNPWCGKQITVDYKGNQIQATIADMCPECADGDIDLSYSAWQKLTGTTEKTRYQADWWLS